MCGHGRVIGAGDDDARGVLEAPERVRREDGVHGVEGDAVAVAVDVAGVRRELVAEAVHDLVRVARLRAGRDPSTSLYDGWCSMSQLSGQGVARMTVQPGLPSASM